MAVRTDDRITARAREIAEREQRALQDRTPASARLFERAVRSLPMGVASTFQAADPYPIYPERGYYRTVPTSKGIPRHQAESTLVVPFNDVASMANAFDDHGDEIAALIM